MNEPDPVGARGRRLLHGPILPTILRLSAPNFLMLGGQVAVSVAEAAYVGRLGTEALAAAGLVYPLVMVLTMMSAGAVGGGIAAAVARAVGAGDSGRTVSLAASATVLSAGLGLAFALGIVFGGPWLFTAMGARDGLLRATLELSNASFALGAPAIWLANGFASVLRGLGRPRTPALVLAGGAVAFVVVAGPLVSGVGGVAGFGLTGAGWAFTGYFLGCAAILGRVLWHELARLRPDAVASARPTRAGLAEILAVGALSTLHTLSINATILLVTAVLAARGDAAVLAGYAIGARLEYLQIPLSFTLGTSLVVLVGTAVGAGDRRRAARIMVVGGLCGAVLCGAVGLTAAAAPALWWSAFTDDPAVAAAAAAYLRTVGPAYPLIGAGMVLYFGAQGARRLVWPLSAVALRVLVVLALVAAAGVVEVRPEDAYAAVVISLIPFAAINMIGVVAFARAAHRRATDAPS